MPRWDDDAASAEAQRDVAGRLVAAERVAEAGGEDLYETEVKLIVAASGAVQLELLRNVEFTATWSVAWSPDGSRLAVCGHPRAKEMQVAIVDTREVTARG